MPDREIRFTVTVSTNASDEDFADAVFERGYVAFRDGTSDLRDLLYEALLEKDFTLEMFPADTSLTIEAI